MRDFFSEQVCIIVSNDVYVLIRFVSEDLGRTQHEEKISGYGRTLIGLVRWKGSSL